MWPPSDRRLAFAVSGAAALALAAGRVWSTVALGPTSGPDSRWYLILDWSGHGRPYVVPAFYALFPGGHSRIAAQAAVASAAWIFAAAVVATLAAPRWRPVAAVAVLAVGWSPLVTYWDRVIYSESLSISLAVVAAAGFLLWARGREPAVLAGSTLALGLWALTRAANVPVALFVGAVLLLAMRWRREAGLAALVLVVASTAGLVLAARETTGVAVASPVVRAQVGDSIDPRTPNLLGIVQVRLLHDPGYRGWMRAHGMPQPAGDADLLTQPALRAWAEHGGGVTYVEFLATHPLYTVSAMSLPDVTAMLAPASFAISNLDDHRAPAFSTPQPVSEVMMSNLYVFLAAVVIALAVSIPVRRDPAVGACVIALVAGWLAMVVIWNGTVVELERISIANVAVLRLAVIALLALATNRSGRAVPARV